MPPESTEKSIVDTSVDSTAGKNNCCRDEIVKTSNLNRKDTDEEHSELDSSIPPIATDESMSYSLILVDTLNIRKRYSFNSFAFLFYFKL